MKHSRGFSIVEYLAALASAAVLVAILATMYERMAQLRTESEISQDVESLVHYLQDALSNPDVCRQAFRSTAGTAGGAPPAISPPGANPVAWDPTAAFPANIAPVGHIQIQNAAVAYMGAFTNQILQGSAAQPRVRISAIQIREPNPAAGFNEGTPARSRVLQGAVQWNVVAAKVVLQFQVSPLAMPQGLPDRTIDVVLGMNPVTNIIGLCYQSSPTSNTNTFCSPANLTGPNCPVPATGCQKFYFVSGFDAQAKPQCDCEIVCATPPSGPPGTFLSGGKKGN